MELKDLIPFLSKYRVKRFRDGDVEIEFEPAELSPSAVIDPPMPSNMPPELKNPETMTMDQVRDWSASPDPESPAEIPMTGDVPLNPEAQS